MLVMLNDECIFFDITLLPMIFNNDAIQFLLYSELSTEEHSFAFE